jgi:hypothetical protein
MIIISSRKFIIHFLVDNIGCLEKENNAHTCKNGGICDSNGNCICPREYTGLTCEIAKKNSQILIDSIILNDKEAYLISSLVSNSNLSLLYRASRDGFDAGSFHKNCDGHSKTLTIIYTELDNVFGGYTSAEWDSVSGNKEDKDAFIFSLRRNGISVSEKFKVKESDESNESHKKEKGSDESNESLKKGKESDESNESHKKGKGSSESKESKKKEKGSHESKESKKKEKGSHGSYERRKNSYAIYCDASYGPTFGYADFSSIANSVATYFDIFVADRSNKVDKSYTHFCSAYECPKGALFRRKSLNHLTGSYNFVAIEIEVFEVVQN